MYNTKPLSTHSREYPVNNIDEEFLLQISLDEENNILPEVIRCILDGEGKVTRLQLEYMKLVFEKLENGSELKEEIFSFLSEENEY